MLRTTLLTLILLMVSAAASAEAPKAKGVYLGLSGGTSLFDDDGAIGSAIDDSDTAIQGYVGYKFMKHFGLEARLADFGSFSDGFDTLELSSISVHAVGYIPFGDSGWELFGQIGFAQIKQEIVGFGSEEDTAGTAGLGIRWHINPKFALAAQIDAYVWQNDAIGSEYDLSVGANLLSAQFNF